jgi:hypothetical protein
MQLPSKKNSPCFVHKFLVPLTKVYVQSNRSFLDLTILTNLDVP